MSGISHIRKKVLGLSQAAVAEITGVSQATVSRWESGEMSPSLRELSLLRDFAREKGVPWDDSWLFEPPPTDPACQPHEPHSSQPGAAA